MLHDILKHLKPNFKHIFQSQLHHEEISPARNSHKQIPP